MGRAILLTLQRDPSANGATTGELLVDGQHECWTCEDVVRPAGEKVPGATAIPAGRYAVVVNLSPRFGVRMPLLVDVPGFEGIRIHPGNTAADTEGCILVGQGRMSAGVSASRAAYAALLPKIEAGLAAGEVWIEVRDAPPQIGG